MDLTLHWLLSKNSLKDLKQLTCLSAQDTIISGVNIMDNPDTFKWIKLGEFILTTGYIFFNDPELQIQTLKKLKESGCAALGIKTKRFFETIPEIMLSCAEELSLPIIELPYYYSLADISDKINKQLYSRQFQEIAKEQSLFNAIFTGYFQQKSLNEILTILRDYYQRSVFILDHQNQCSWHSFMPEDEKAFPANGPFYLMPLSAQIPTEKGGFQTFNFLLRDTKRTALKLPFSNHKYFLCITTEASDTIQETTLNHILKIIDFSSINYRMVKSSIANYYDSFFQYLLDTRNHSEASAIQLSEYYGIPYPSECVCIAFASGDNQFPFTPQYLIQRIKNIQDILSFPQKETFLAYNQNLICLYLFGSKTSYKSIVHDFVTELLKQSSENITIGISQFHCNNLADAFKQASFSLSLSKYFPGETLFYFQDYFIFWQLSKMSEEERNNIYQFTVKPLVDHDKENNSNLTETLLKYFECHLNSSLAASKLFIHRNTFLKRMDKIQSLIDFHPDSHHNLFSIYYGLCIYQMLKP